jgi:DNA-binding transcriptional ArsR family regulator
MKPVKVLSDPKTFELLADSTRRQIVNLLKARELTVSQIAEQLSKTPQTIYHHMRKLVEGGLVEVSRQETVENFIERYYRATAEIFEVRHGEGDVDLDEADIGNVLHSLSMSGIIGKIDDKSISRSISIMKKMRTLGFGPDLQEKLDKLKDADLAIKLHTVEYAEVLLMSDHDFAEYQKLQREYREILKGK